MARCSVCQAEVKLGDERCAKCGARIVPATEPFGSLDGQPIAKGAVAALPSAGMSHSAPAGVEIVGPDEIEPEASDTIIMPAPPEQMRSDLSAPFRLPQKPSAEAQSGEAPSGVKASEVVAREPVLTPTPSERLGFALTEPPTAQKVLSATSEKVASDSAPSATRVVRSEEISEVGSAWTSQMLPPGAGVTGAIPGGEVAPASLTVRKHTVVPMPAIPNAGQPLDLIRYVVLVGRAVFQRNRAIRKLLRDKEAQAAVKETSIVELGREVARLRLPDAAFVDDLRALEEAESRHSGAASQLKELKRKQQAESAKWNEAATTLKDVQAEKQSLHADAERALRALQDQRDSARDKMKELDSQARGYQKSADDKEAKGQESYDPAVRAAIRREAESLRKEADRLVGPRSDEEKKIDSLSAPIREAEERFESTKQHLEEAKRRLTEASRAHEQEMSQIAAEEQKQQKMREQAGAELSSRHAALGKVANVHRVLHPDLVDVYGRIDSIGRVVRELEREIELLHAEKQARDQKSLLRGGLWISGGLLLLIVLIVLLVRIF